MELQYTLFPLLASLAAAASVITVLYARRYRDSAPAETSILTALILSVLGWIVLNTLELVAPTAAGTLSWAQMTYLFIAATPVAWFAFALQYARRRQWLAPGRFAWLCIIPILTIVLAQTNQWHGLIWQSYEFKPVAHLLAMHVLSYGIWFWISTSYSYLLVFGGALLISQQYFRALRLYRQQSVLVIIGALIPIVANLIYLFDLIPGLQKDYTSISFALASIAFAVGILRYHLFDLRPVARDVVVDNMSDAMFALDLQDRIVDLNPAAQRLVTALYDLDAREEVIGQPIVQVVQGWPAFVDHLRAATEKQADVALELDGDWQHYDLHVSALTGRRGRPTGRLVILHNVTIRKEVEEKLRQYARVLEKQNKELDAFAHTVAHDLKNPLFVVIAASECLESGLEEMPLDEVRRFLASILRSGNTMIHIVDELLLLARVRRDEDVTVVPLNVESLISQVEKRLSPQIDEAKARLTKPASWPMAVGYGPWVEEVWVNYVSNALKYGGQPDKEIPPLIELGHDRNWPGPGQIEDRDYPGSHVRFWVRDNGPGLSREEQVGLFTEFSRMATSRVEGHGLGLSIVRRIVERLGGEVGVESTPGQGSLFWFTLPQRGREIGP
jgi:PAS domain S-box-containing protein